MKMRSVSIAAAFAFVLASAPASSPVKQTSHAGEVRVAFQRLMSDTKAALADSEVSPTQWQAIKISVGAAIDGANRPALATTKKLAATIQLARQDGVITDAERAAIYQTFKAVLASANIPLEEAAAVRDALLAVAMSANVTPDEVMVILGDLRVLLEALPAPRRA